MKANIKHPPAKYRPIPFWSWNDRLRCEEIRRQIQLMEKAGFGGFFMHARGGLRTKYMSDEWIAAVEAGIDEGTKKKINPWLYDENGWPSGFADGIVNGQGIDFQQKFLRLEIVQSHSLTTNERTVCVITPKLKPYRNEQESITTVYHIYYEINPYYVDTLNREVALKFLEETHGRYEKLLTKESWKGIQGFFIDEPTISRNGIPWSFTIEAEYRSRYSEELLPLLPSLFEDVGNYNRNRYRFWSVVSRLFRENFLGEIYHWCERHDLKLTGHLVEEETFATQQTSNGELMPLYEYFHIPGMDWLGRNINPASTPLQVSSVAHQLGRKQILSETFALTGWNITFEELRWIAGWQMVMGITLLCPHLSAYSLKGIRKRDYPPSLHYQQPWWPQFKAFNDTVSRIGMLLSEGKVSYQVLLLHTHHSAWLDGTRTDREEYFKDLIELTDLINGNHINFHYGDPEILMNHGSVVGGRLIVGHQNYKIVILPRFALLTKPVLNLLLEFTKQGGIILSIEQSINPNLLLEGEQGHDFTPLLKEIQFFHKRADMVRFLRNHIEAISIYPETPQSEEGKEEQIHEILYTKRIFSGEENPFTTAYYLVNTDKEKEYAAKITLPLENVCLFEPLSGNISRLDYQRKEKGLSLSLNFPPMGQFVLLGNCTCPISPKINRTPADKRDRTILLDGKSPVRLHDLNSLTMDRCCFYFNDVLQEKEGYVNTILDRILKSSKETSLKMEFHIESDVDFARSTELYLVLETPELFQIEINKTVVASVDCGFYRDISFRKIDIRGLLIKGKNDITIRGLITPSHKQCEQIRKAAKHEAEKNKLTLEQEIESIYLVGDFAVKTEGAFTPLSRDAEAYSGRFILTHPPVEADNRLLIREGFPFYNGTVSIKKIFHLDDGELNGWYLSFNRLYGQAAEIMINGRVLDTIYWRPYSVPLGKKILKRGNNLIEIRITNSLRNLLGPHHLKEGESYFVGPFSFYKEDGIFSRDWEGNLSEWTEDYNFVPLGIEGLELIHESDSP